MVFCSDSLTNAGMDQVSTYSKMFHFGIDGERQIVILCAGNLATSQATIATIKSDIKKDADVNLLNIETLEEAADYIGDISREQQEKRTIEGKKFEASFILGGQIGSAKHEDHPHLSGGESHHYLQGYALSSNRREQVRQANFGPHPAAGPRSRYLCHVRTRFHGLNFAQQSQRRATN